MLTMALLGGVQSPFGAVLGTFTLVILPEWLRFLRQAYLAIYGGAVILIMIFLPDGIWGWAARRLSQAPAADHRARPAVAAAVRQRRRRVRLRAGGRGPGQAFRRREGGGRSRPSRCGAAACMR